MEAPSFALIPSGFKTAKVYSVIPESGVGDLTFDRNNNTATRINKDGLIESVLADVPRLNYEVTNGIVDSCPHLLLEMNSTNLITYSENFSGYTTINSSVSSNVISSPDGSLNASKLIENTATAEHTIQKQVSVTSGNAYSISVFVKKEEISTVQFGFTGSNFASPTRSIFDIENGAITTNVSNTASIQNYGNGWYKLKVTNTTNATGTAMLILQTIKSGQASYAGDGVSGFYIWGLQWEQESYCTSYIPTSGSTQSRASESCTGAGDVNTFNSVQGILYAELKRDIATDNGFRRVNINDGSLNNTVRLGYSTVTDEIKGVITVGGATQCALVFAGLSVTSFRKMALLYKANQFELWVDGSKRAEDTSGSTFPINTLDNLSFEQANASDKLRAKVKDVRYYDTDGMSNTEITNLLTQLTQ